MPSIRQAQTEEDRASVRELFWEYLQWANSRVNEEFGVNFDIAAMLEGDMANLEFSSRQMGGSFWRAKDPVWQASHV